jgi:hypothetical protein
VFPPQTDNFPKPINFKSVLGNEFFGKKGEKPSEEKPSDEKLEPKQNPKPKPFHCEHCGRDGHLAEFCFRRKREERLARELANKDRYRPSRGVPSLGWCREARVWCVPFTLERGVSLCLEERHHIKKVVGVLGLSLVRLLDVPLLVADTSMGGTIAVLGHRGATGHSLPFVVRVVLEGDVWVFHLGEIGWIFLTPCLSKWRGTSLIRLVLSLVLSPLLTLALVFDFAGGRHGGLLVDQLWLLSTHDRRSTVVLQPHPSDDQGLPHFWG